MEALKKSLSILVRAKLQADDSLFMLLNTMLYKTLSRKLPCPFSKACLGVEQTSHED